MRDFHERLWEGLPEGLTPPALDLRRAFLREHLSGVAAGAGSSVLDVGCGEGQLTAELAGTGLNVVGIDVAEEPLRRARASHPELDLRLVPAEGPWPWPMRASTSCGRARRSSTLPIPLPGYRRCAGCSARAARCC